MEQRNSNSNPNSLDHGFISWPGQHTLACWIMFLEAFFNTDENWSIWGDDLDEGWTELSPCRESMSLPWCHFHSSIWKPAEDLHHGSHAGLHLLNMKVGLVGQGLRPERRPALRSWSCQTTMRLRHGPSKTHKTVECADYGTGSGNSSSWNLISCSCTLNANDSEIRKYLPYASVTFPQSNSSGMLIFLGFGSGLRILLNLCLWGWILKPWLNSDP